MTPKETLPRDSRVGRFMPLHEIAFLAAVAAASGVARGDGPKMGSTVAVDPLERGTWVVDQERDEVALISGKDVVKSFEVGAWPEQLVVACDGTVFVSSRAAGRIAVIDPEMHIKSVAVGAEPRSIALSEEEEKRFFRQLALLKHAPNPPPAPKVKAPEYNVPSLKNVALTAPYFHDGSAETLDEPIARNADRMGNTSASSPDDRKALVAYLETL